MTGEVRMEPEVARIASRSTEAVCSQAPLDTPRHHVPAARILFSRSGYPKRYKPIN